MTQYKHITDLERLAIEHALRLGVRALPSMFDPTRLFDRIYRILQDCCSERRIPYSHRKQSRAPSVCRTRSATGSLLDGHGDRNRTAIQLRRGKSAVQTQKPHLQSQGKDKGRDGCGSISSRLHQSCLILSILSKNAASRCINKIRGNPRYP